MFVLVTVSFMIMVDIVVVEEAEEEVNKIYWDEGVGEDLIEGGEGEDWSRQSWD